MPCATHEVFRLEPSRVAPSQARREIRNALGNLVSDEVVETAELLVSELVTNAITHGSGVVIVAIDCADRQLAVTVSDDEPEQPHIQPEQLMAVGGRGMQLIEALASEWGVKARHDGPGKAVWFRLP